MMTKLMLIILIWMNITNSLAMPLTNFILISYTSLSTTIHSSFLSLLFVGWWKLKCVNFTYSYNICPQSSIHKRKCTTQLTTSTKILFISKNFIAFEVKLLTKILENLNMIRHHPTQLPTTNNVKDEIMYINKF